MDPLSALLDAGERAIDTRLRTPWSVTLADPSRVTIVAVADGDAWCHCADGEALHLQSGDVVFLRPDSGHVLSDSAERPKRQPDCPARQTSGATAGAKGAVVCGESACGDTRMFIRTLVGGEGPTLDFLDSLAREQVLTCARDSCIWPLLRNEADHLSVATTSVVTRLVDLLFIDAVRRWLDQGEAQGWMKAVLDPVVGAALQLFHEQPEQPWTLQEVADRVGSSRASLARRFQLLVGEPPMTYLLQWRLSRAAEILEQGDTSVASAARRSGFEDLFEFSAAFSKRFGMPPLRYREGGASAGSA